MNVHWPESCKWVFLEREATWLPWLRCTAIAEPLWPDRRTDLSHPPRGCLTLESRRIPILHLFISKTSLHTNVSLVSSFRSRLGKCFFGFLRGGGCNAPGQMYLSRDPGSGDHIAWKAPLARSRSEQKQSPCVLFRECEVAASRWLRRLGRSAAGIHQFWLCYRLNRDADTMRRRFEICANRGSRKQGGGQKRDKSRWRRMRNPHKRWGWAFNQSCILRKRQIPDGLIDIQLNTTGTNGCCGGRRREIYPAEMPVPISRHVGPDRRGPRLVQRDR